MIETGSVIFVVHARPVGILKQPAYEREKKRVLLDLLDGRIRYLPQCSALMNRKRNSRPSWVKAVENTTRLDTRANARGSIAVIILYERVGM